jgi:hypothetical protein
MMTCADRLEAAVNRPSAYLPRRFGCPNQELARRHRRGRGRGPPRPAGRVRTLHVNRPRRLRVLEPTRGTWRPYGIGPALSGRIAMYPQQPPGPGVRMASSHPARGSRRRVARISSRRAARISHRPEGPGSRRRAVPISHLPRGVGSRHLAARIGRRESAAVGCGSRWRPPGASSS